MVTADSVRDAGIAAHLAVDPAVLPEPSIYFQDFNFGGTMFDALFGNAEALGGVGAGISDVALEERMALEAEDRKKDDPAGDASMITELATRQREEAVRFMNGTYYLNGMSISEIEMEEALTMTRAELDEIAETNNWTASQRMQAERTLDRAESATGQERADILSGADNTLPGLTDAIGSNVLEIRSRGANNDLSMNETNDKAIGQSTDDRNFVAQREITRDDISGVSTNIAARNNLSVGENPFADTRSPNSEFNAQASGVEIAEITPSQEFPNPAGPVLSQG